ncbi:MAG: beta-propeller fold lactonase family protein, partial [Thermoguttaceae bacterium]
HPTGRYAYVINELHSTVTAMRYDARRGILSPIQTITTLPEGFDGRNSTAEVEVHPSGKFLYGSNRGHDSIACFAIDQATGRLTWLGSQPTQGKTPRNFGIDPTGKYLLAANQNSDNVVVFRIDTSTGHLLPTGQSLTVPSPVCVKFVAMERAPDWSNWRGPEQTGRADTGPMPVEWTADENLAWKIELPGRGCSTPIVRGDQIIVTVPIDDHDAVLSLDFAGKVRWQTTFGPQIKGKNRAGSGCNPSPVTDGRFLFVYYKTGTLAGLDLSGKILWQTNLQERFGKAELFWDVGTSPVLTQRHVVVAVMHAGESFLAAFDKSTGTMAWKVARQYDCPIEGDQSYTTPIVMQQDDRQTILVWGAEHVTCHRADDGKAVWSCGGFNPEAKKLWVSVASAVVAGETVVVPYGRGTHLAGVRLGGSGDVTATHRRWTRDDIGAFVPTPAAQDGKVYLLGDEGQVTCLDPATGRTIWAGALPKHRTKYYASPTVADGKLYAAREDGTIVVAQVVGPFKVLSENPMEEQVIATPVPIADGLLLRGERHLFFVKSP